jgi:hypothetical protein
VLLSMSRSRVGLPGRSILLLSARVQRVGASWRGQTDWGWHLPLRWRLLLRWLLRWRIPLWLLLQRLLLRLQLRGLLDWGLKRRKGRLRLDRHLRWQLLPGRHLALRLAELHSTLRGQSNVH